MMNRIISWSPYDKRQFVSNGSNRLDLIELIELEDSPNNTLHTKVDLHIAQFIEPNQLSCIDWHPYDDSSLLAYGTAQGAVHLMNWSKNSEVKVWSAAKLGKKPCNAVSWNKQVPHQLAAGFENIKSDHCVVLWDFAHEKVQKVAYSDSVCSMSWLPDNPHVLVLGTSSGWVRLHDIRSGTAAHSQTASSGMSFLAHPAPRPRRVKGIRCDPFHHTVLATFSDGVGDVVRLWDLRKHGVSTPSTGKGVPALSHIFTVVPNTSSTNAVVQDVAWSPARPNVLATVTVGQRSVSFFSTCRQSAEDPMTATPIFQIAAPEPVKALSWRGLDARHVETFSLNGGLCETDVLSSSSPKDAGLSSPGRIVAQWDSFKSDEMLQHFPSDFFGTAPDNDKPTKYSGASSSSGSNAYSSPFNHLLVAMNSGVLDVDVRERCALAVSTGGVVCSSAGESIHINNGRSAHYPHCIQEDSVAQCLNNAALVTQYRAEMGYSIDETKNLEVLAGEMDHIYSLIHAQNTALLNNSLSAAQKVAAEESVAQLSTLSGAILDIYKMWLWVDRFEALSNQTNLSLVSCGVLDIIQNETNVADQQQNYICLFHPALGVEVYNSKSRFLCKKICGWIDVTGVEREAKNSVGRLSPGYSAQQRGGASASHTSRDVSGGSEEEDSEGLLEIIIQECLDGFERAAAIALWHGNLNLAVQVLRQEISKYDDSGVVASSSGAVSGPPSPKVSRSRSASQQPAVEDLMSPYSEVLSPDFRDTGDDEDEDEDEENNIDWDTSVTPEYMKLVSLVGMCLAGYNYTSNNRGSSSGAGDRGRSTSNANQQSSAWAGMCKHVLTQLQHSKRRATSYLEACCVFLLTNLNDFSADDYVQFSHGRSAEGLSSKGSTKAGYRLILEDSRILLEDRIAFAATFLPNSQAVDWYGKVRDSSKDTGKLDGIAVTGLSADGIDILQKYVDRCDDVQTVALLVSRIIDSGVIEGTSRPTKEWIWLHEYRHLLNKWGMFIERAKLDVEIGKRYRSRSAVSAQKGGGGRGGPETLSKGGRGAPSGGAFGSFKGKPQQYPFSKSSHQPQQDRSKRILYKISPHSDFPHIYLRCSYCGTSLPIDGMQTNKAESLRSQKSILNCCASCSKQLPRCYVCQLYMGMVNPYRELNRTMTQKRINADNMLNDTKSTTDPQTAASHHSSQQKSDHNVIDFGRWFFFCQHCRHGGHATCIDQWFGGSALAADCCEEENKLIELSNGKSTQRIVCGVNGCQCNCKARK